MITKIDLQIENVPGVQLRVINTLKKHGLLTVNQAIRDTSDSGKVMSLEVEGDESLDKSAITDIVNDIKGVETVLDISGEIAEAVAELELTEDEKRYKNHDSEAGDTEIRDRMLIFSLLSRYPNIANRLIELKSTIPAEEQQLRLYQLGQGFGKNLLTNLKVKDVIPDLATALEKVIMPGLQPLADFHLQDNVISVESFSKNLDRGKPDELLCHFFRGAIEGLLKGIADLAPHHVEKKQCLHKGENCCEYLILPA